MNEVRDDWGFFILVFFLTCFFVIWNYGPIMNIFIWICYMSDKKGNSDWDMLHKGLIGVFIVINIILSFLFMKYW